MEFLRTFEHCSPGTDFVPLSLLYFFQSVFYRKDYSMDQLLDRFYYFVVEHPDGRLWAEGYLSEQETRAEMDKRIADGHMLGDHFAAEHTTYVGESLPASEVEKQIRSIEQMYAMHPLSGSEKQIAWARVIRYRYGRYLLYRFSDQRGHALFEERGQETRASWWIDHRYELTTTMTDSRYVADGIKP
jgi:hypothetical protein